MPTPSEELYREISLTQGQVAIVDSVDFEELNKFKWCARFYKNIHKFYALRNYKDMDGKKYLIPMHRAILGLKKGDKRMGDHINMNTLDNRRGNLRIATHAENNRNRKAYRNNTSGYKGVSWNKTDKRFSAKIKVDGKLIHLGNRLTAEEAHRELYVPASLKFHGDFGRVR